MAAYAAIPYPGSKSFPVAPRVKHYSRRVLQSFHCYSDIWAKMQLVAQLLEAQRAIVNTIREFVRREVVPVAQRMEHEDEYPFELVDRMKELGLFGAIIPEEYGGLALSFTTYALVIEELCRGWMSLSGILNSHLIMAYMVTTNGTQGQKERLLPAMASGEKRGGICITEPDTGSDVQAIQTKAVRDGDDYVVNGAKSLITNGRNGNNIAEALADPQVQLRNMVVEIEHPVAGRYKTAGNPIKTGGNERLQPPPTLGEHTDQLLQDLLGYSSSDVAYLRQTGAV